MFPTPVYPEKGPLQRAIPRQTPTLQDLKETQKQPDASNIFSPTSGRRHEAAAWEIRRGFETSKLVQACWRTLDIKLPCKVTFKDTCKVQESQVYLTLAWGVTLQD